MTILQLKAKQKEDIRKGIEEENKERLSRAEKTLKCYNECVKDKEKYTVEFTARKRKYGIIDKEAWICSQCGHTIDYDNKKPLLIGLKELA